MRQPQTSLKSSGVAVEYASQQPQGYDHYISKIAIVGATGKVGSHIVEHLLDNSRLEVTAITRNNSSAAIPEGVNVAKVDYSDPSTLVDALRGQDALIVTMSATAPKTPRPSSSRRLRLPGAPWVIPNEWGTDPEDKELANDILVGPVREAARKHIQDLGKSSFIGICCGLWYELSLAGTELTYGFDFPSREVMFYDDGLAKVNTSTWPQCGRAVANLLALKVLPDNEADKIRLYLNMLDSVLRVTGDKAGDWTINYQPSFDRYMDGVHAFNEGDMRGFGKAMYARTLYLDGSGNYEAKRALHNKILDLPQESLDDFTAVAVEWTKASSSQ